MDNMHDDQTQDLDMIKNILQKVIDEMNTMESNRILPDGHPKKMTAVEATISPEGSPEEESMESPDQENSELDPAVLKELMDKAGQSDESGALPEDHQDDLPPEVAAAVAARKKKPV